VLVKIKSSGWKSFARLLSNSCCNRGVNRTVRALLVLVDFRDPLLKLSPIQIRSQLEEQCRLIQRSSFPGAKADAELEFHIIGIMTLDLSPSGIYGLSNQFLPV
jgi:hypothetical protein